MKLLNCSRYTHTSIWSEHRQTNEKYIISSVSNKFRAREEENFLRVAVGIGKSADECRYIVDGIAACREHEGFSNIIFHR